MSAAATVAVVAKRVLTEDTGKIFERAICLAYSIPYEGAYKYGLDAPTALLPRLAPLPTLFPLCRHTAARGARYDFTATDDSRHLSVKSTKGNTMVAPQCVGQAQPAKFCERMGLPAMEVPILKAYIQAHIAELLPTLLDYTIGGTCDVLYYNQKTNKMKYIRRVADIPWDTYSYSWSTTAEKWNNSAKLRIHTPASAKPLPLLEVQFHSASRTNMAVRWCFEALLTVGGRAFETTDL
jgi:hypothetical protein